MPRPHAVTYQHDGHAFLAQRLGRRSGPPIVLVHGIGVASAYFRPLARRLAGSADVHVLELPGFGRARKPAAPLSVAELADVVNGYVAAVGLDRPTLVGHSMGGQIVVEAALQEPDRVLTVVAMGCVVDPGARTAPQQGLRLLWDLLRETPSANWAVLRDYVRTGPRWYLATVPLMLAYRTEEAVLRLRVPLLVVRGARDPIVSREWSEQLSRLAPVARFVEVPGAAHVVMHTHPHVVASQILDHTADVAGAAGSSWRGVPLDESLSAGVTCSGQMSDQPMDKSPGDVSDARQEAVEHVVKRAESWDEGAALETVRKDLEQGMGHAGVQVEEDELDRVAEQIHDEGTADTPDVE